MRLPRIALCALLATVGGLAHAPGGAHAATAEYVPVGDPLEDEFRWLDLEAAGPGPRLDLRHLGTRPLLRRELIVPADTTAPAGVGAIARARIERDLATGGAWDGVNATPRLVSWRSPDGGLAELSLSVRGEHEALRESGRWRDHWRDGSGVHARAGVGGRDWLLFSDMYAGSLARARAIGDPLISDTDIALHTEETYASVASPHGELSAQFGRSRWHWGPGRESSLLLSRTAPAMTGLAVHARIEPLGADFTVLNATLSTRDQRQLAAHRVEWRPASALRVGLAEAAVYRASGWRPIYAIGLVAYSLAQRLEAEENSGADTTGSERNNVMAAADVSWRVADGTRVYAEGLVDDLHAHTATVPNKWGVQLGLDGRGDVRGTRLSWNAEWTRVSRWVYTSFFGAQAQIRDEPLGSVLGPDSERLRTHVAWDPNADWQLTLDAVHSRKGENGLDEPFVPGGPVPDPGSFEGTVETTRELEAGLRWWPGRAVDVRIAAGWFRVDDAGHVPGAHREGASARVAFALAR